jgi:hypothetical protein
MRFRLGHAGYDKLADMEQLSDHPQIALIRERVEATRAAESYREILAQPTILLTVDDISQLDPDHSLPEDLLQAVASSITRNQTRDCKEESACLIARVMLDGDDDYEYLFVLSGLDDYEILAYDRNGEGEWEKIGEMHRIGPDRELPNRPAFLDTLQLQGATPLEVHYRDLVIGGIRLRLDERRR